MYKYFLIMLGTFLVISPFAQDNEDKILGKWSLEEHNHVIEFVKNGSIYEGFIREAEHPSVINVKQISSLKYDTDKSYKDGTFYVIRKDRKVNCSAVLVNDTLMELKVKFGPMSNTLLWTRLKPDSTEQ